MEHVMRLKAGATTVNFSPDHGWTNEQDRRRTSFVAQDGTEYIQDWGSKEKWTLPVSNISATDHSAILGWFQNVTSLTFYPHYAAGSITTNYTCRLMNKTNPLRVMKWGTLSTAPDKYMGELIIKES